MEYEKKQKHLEFLIKDEEEAIEGYAKVIKDLGAEDDDLGELTEIMQEEIRHKYQLTRMLNATKVEKTDHNAPVSDYYKGE